MLASTMIEAPATEGLRNYLLGNRGRPVDVSAFDQSGVRQTLSLPNGAVPGVQNPIPTSSARPGKMTNQRIVYSRVQTAFSKSCGAIDLTPVREGDAVFVHRQDGLTSVGNDTNRTSRVATLMQLNGVLGSYSGPDDVGSIVMPLTDPAGNVLSPRGLTEDDYVAERVAVGILAADALREWNSGNFDRVAYRWKHCTWLAQWTPDGILASNEHDCVMDNSNPGEVYNIAIGGPTLMRNAPAGDFPQHFDDGLRALDKVFIGLIGTEKRDGDDGAGNPSYWTFRYKLFTSRQLLWSQLAAPTTVTAVTGGPLCSKWKRVSKEEAANGVRLGGGGAPRLIDALAAGQSSFTVAAFNALDAADVTAASLQPDNWVKTGDQANLDVGEYFMPDAKKPEIRINAAHAGGDNTLGPSAGEFRRMVQVWRLGSVFDTRSGMMPYRCVTVNVVVEEWTLNRVAAEFNDNFSNSPALFPLADPATSRLDGSALVTAALAWATGARRASIQAVYYEFNPLAVSHTEALEVIDSVRQWTDVNRLYQKAIADANARGIAPGNVPVPVATTTDDLVNRNYHGYAPAVKDTNVIPYNTQLYFKAPTVAARRFAAANAAAPAPGIALFGTADRANWALVGRAMTLANKLPGREADFAILQIVHDQFMAVASAVSIARQIAARPVWVVV